MSNINIDTIDRVVTAADIEAAGGAGIATLNFVEVGGDVPNYLTYERSNGDLIISAYKENLGGDDILISSAKVVDYDFQDAEYVLQAINDGEASYITSPISILGGNYNITGDEYNYVFKPVSDCTITGADADDTIQFTYNSLSRYYGTNEAVNNILTLSNDDVSLKLNDFFVTGVGVTHPAIEGTIEVTIDENGIIYQATEDYMEHITVGGNSEVTIKGMNELDSLTLLSGIVDKYAFGREVTGNEATDGVLVVTNKIQTVRLSRFFENGLDFDVNEINTADMLLNVRTTQNYLCTDYKENITIDANNLVISGIDEDDTILMNGVTAEASFSREASSTNLIINGANYTTIINDFFNDNVNFKVNDIFTEDMLLNVNADVNYAATDYAEKITVTADNIKLTNLSEDDTLIMEGATLNRTDNSDALILNNNILINVEVSDFKFDESCDFKLNDTLASELPIRVTLTGLLTDHIYSATGYKENIIVDTEAITEIVGFDSEIDTLTMGAPENTLLLRRFVNGDNEDTNLVVSTQSGALTTSTVVLTDYFAEESNVNVNGEGIYGKELNVNFNVGCDYAASDNFNENFTILSDDVVLSNLKATDTVVMETGITSYSADGGTPDSLYINAVGEDSNYTVQINDFTENNSFSVMSSEGIDNWADKILTVSNYKEFDGTLAPFGSLNIIGTDANDTYVGYIGNDTIAGGVGNDLITGGKGNDLLAGGTGVDTFIFKTGDGTDIIADGQSRDLIEFEDVAFENLTFVRPLGSNDLEILYGGENDIVTIKDFYAGNAIDTVVTLDGDELVEHFISDDATIAVELGNETYVATQYKEKFTLAPEAHAVIENMGNDDTITLMGALLHRNVNDTDLLISRENESVTITDFNFDNEHDFLLNGVSTAEHTVFVELSEDETCLATDYHEVFSGTGSVMGLNADDIVAFDNAVDYSVNGEEEGALIIENIDSTIKIADYDTMLDNEIDLAVTVDGVLEDFGTKTLLVSNCEDFDGLDYPFGNVLIDGTDEDDIYIGSEGNDIIYGGKGDDYINGYDGDDVIVGGEGNNYIYGGQGNDTLIGGTEGNLYGFDICDGDDSIEGATREDKLYFSNVTTDNLSFAIGENKELIITSTIEAVDGDENPIIITDHVTVADFLNDDSTTTVDKLYDGTGTEYSILSLMGGEHYVPATFASLTFERLDDNLIVTSPDMENPVVYDNFFGEGNFGEIYTTDGIYNIENSALINVDLNNFADGYVANPFYKEAITGSGNVQGLTADDKVVINGEQEPVSFTANGKVTEGVVISTDKQTIDVVDYLANNNFTVVYNNEVVSIEDSALTVFNHTNFDASGLAFGLVEMDGTNKNDNLEGGNVVNLITGGVGDDVLTGGAGNDIIHGGNGNDALHGLAGLNILYGGLGHDKFYFKAGEETIVADATINDELYFDNATVTSLAFARVDAERPYDLDIRMFNGELMVGRVTISDYYKQPAASRVDTFYLGDVKQSITSNAAVDVVIAPDVKKYTSGNANESIDASATNGIKIETGRGAMYAIKGSASDSEVAKNNDVIDARKANGFVNITEETGTNKIFVGGKSNLTAELTGNSSNTVSALGGSEILIDTVGTNTITLGLKDDEIIIGNAEKNVIKAGAGDNSFYIGYTYDENYDLVAAPGGDNNIISSGIGSDYYDIANGTNTITSGNGADMFEISGGINTITAGNGQKVGNLDMGNYFEISGGNNIIKSGSRNDLFTVTGGDNELNGGAGNDVYDLSAYNDDYIVSITDKAGNSTLALSDKLDIFFSISNVKATTYQDGEEIITVAKSYKTGNEITYGDVAIFTGKTIYSVSEIAAGGVDYNITKEQVDYVAQSVANWLAQEGYASTDEAIYDGRGEDLNNVFAALTNDYYGQA